MAYDPRALTSISYGLYVVTSRDGDRRNGQIANAVMQVTGAPCRVAVAIARANLTHDFIAASRVFGVTVLNEETPLPFIGRFGFKSGRDGDKLEGVGYKLGETGCPLVTDYAVAVLDARVVDAVTLDTHTVFVGEVVAAEVVAEGKPLTYEFYHQIKKGKTSRNAPTYQAPTGADKQRSDTTMKKYVCQVCGYVYDPAVGDADGGVPAGTAFEALPADWVCPVCGAAKDQFQPES